MLTSSSLPRPLVVESTDSSASATGAGRGFLAAVAGGHMEESRPLPPAAFSLRTQLYWSMPAGTSSIVLGRLLLVEEKVVAQAVWL